MPLLSAKILNKCLGTFLRKYNILKELVFYNIPVLQLQPC